VNLKCDCCDKPVDRELDDGHYDRELGIYCCERCLNHWEAYVVGGVMEQEKQT
jgi:hypothetical protein